MRFFVQWNFPVELTVWLLPKSLQKRPSGFWLVIAFAAGGQDSPSRQGGGRGWRFSAPKPSCRPAACSADLIQRRNHALACRLGTLQICLGCILTRILPCLRDSLGARQFDFGSGRVASQMRERRRFDCHRGVNAYLSDCAFLKSTGLLDYDARSRGMAWS